MSMRPLVTTDWLHQHLQDDDIRIVEASWHLPAAGRDARSEFETVHIPGAVFFDIDEHSSPSHLPHTMPTADMFASAAGKLGISKTDTIVVYDSLGLFSAARVWWMFRYFGAQNVYVLDGGLPAWLSSDHAVAKGLATPEPAHFEAGRSALAIASADDVLQASVSGDSLILDARSHPRFLGVEKEARQGLRSGHIPGSKSMPFSELLENGYVKSDDELRALLLARDATGERPIITSCGSGVTAAVISLALECIGVSNVALYDGSWTEWGALTDMPVATGEA
ncbi:3-mercaptopyruvate sulfurtransferase [Granulosicoccus antarcticus]|uniref:Sulfurtransferase n=1 Tax=Granulosicoccus antarcticus IMCC3135 TaxID=1192854 RepID=A0A2Z2NMQ9_9GAMM|nr:3-mercaptopyruvate sulfurtransferase [Granulosicoccus antarcticus]ASJ72666.1 3-mercaptopyruvate sulfurtransferase [Granulosicoccus antarcticus IMCC3135]